MINEATALALDRHPRDGRIVLGLMERLWLLPATGGTAVALTPPGLRLTQPRFSADGKSIIAQGDWRDDRTHLWRIDTASGSAERLMAGDWRDTDAHWHPDGKRLLFVSDRAGSDDIWEYDVDARAARPLTTMPGAESGPVYSHDGEQLIYVSAAAGTYTLMRQYYAGRPDALYSSQRRISAPTVRRDGILITFMEQGDEGRWTLNMLLPVREMLVKTLIDDAGLADHPVVWRDRDHYIVARGGRLEQRELAGREQQPIEFTAWLSIQPASGGEVITVRAEGPPAEAPTPAPGPFVLRAARLFDAVSRSYRFEQDVLIEDGRIAEIAPRRHWPDRQVIDMGDASLIPGLIDIDTSARLSPGRAFGRELLAAGVTTLASATADDAGAPLPGWRTGPRVIRLNTVVDVRGIVDRRERIASLTRARTDGHPAITDRLLPDLTLGAAMLSADALPASFPARPLYADVRGLLEKSGVRIVSGVRPRSGWTAEDWQRLRNSRLARTGQANAGSNGFDGSHAAGPSLPAALEMVAELITKQRSGTAAASALAGVTIGAANVLRRDDLGRIEVGALADIVVVAGDPLDDIATLVDTVAVVSRGEFMSVAGLLENSTGE